jgi:hypothetical protein
MKGVNNMAIKKYIGARYAPKFMGAWDKSSEYAALSVVYTNDKSYVSRKTVPANTEITNTEFWIPSADWNAQVAQYNQNVERYQANVEQYNQNVETYTQAVDQFYADTLHSYDTKAEMVADRSLKLGDTLLTCGNASIGDGGGSFYQVVPETSAKAVALENGLFALPFEFQPYDYSEFQGEVDRVVESFGTSVAEIKAASLGTYDNVAKMKADTTLKANTTVLTTGEATVGDNRGSFYRVQETSERDDAVPLDNGKMAVPFALNVGAVAGTALTFNGRSDAAAVWNVKAPGTVTIPLSVPAGGTATVFLGVLYGDNESTVTATLNINNGKVKTMTFTDKGDATHDKICVYAITVKKTDVVNWSYSTIASWQVAYSHDIITTRTAFGSNAPAAPSKTTGFADLGIKYLTVSEPVHLSQIEINLPNLTLGDGQVPYYNKFEFGRYTQLTAPNIDWTTLVNIPITQADMNKIKTFNVNVDLEPGETYVLDISIHDNNTQVPYWDLNVEAKNGTYGPFTANFDSSISNWSFNGVLITTKNA